MERVIVYRITPLKSPRSLSTFERFVGWCFKLSNWTLAESARPDWQNYAASLGIASVRAAASITVMMRSFQTQGAASITREVIELSCKFIEALDQKDSAWMSAVCKDIAELKRIAEESKAAPCPWTSNVHKQLQIQQQRKVALKKQNIKGVPEEKPNRSHIGSTGDAAYAYLCLSTHNHVTPLMSKYAQHWWTQKLDPFQQESVEDLEIILGIAFDAMSAAITKYLNSDLFPQDQRESHLKQLGELTQEFWARSAQ
jgi:hypothetical protein